MYNQTYNQGKIDIKINPEYIYITTGSWISIKIENYITITCYFIDFKFESKSYFLSF